MELLCDNELVGTGRLMPNLQQVHGRKLKSGWVAVEVTDLNDENVESWSEFPTHSGFLEKGSFSAWPKDGIRAAGDKQSKAPTGEWCASLI